MNEAPAATATAGTETPGARPPLWNPNAAAAWSILFTPAFGGLVHMKNWRALGEPARAARSLAWAIVSPLVIVGLGAAARLWPRMESLSGLSNYASFGLLVTWYAFSGRAQATAIRQRFGSAYRHRGWGMPLLIAFAVWLLVIAGLVLAAQTGRRWAAGG